MKVKVGNEVIIVKVQGGKTYGGKSTLGTVRIPCRRLPGEQRIEWVALETVSFKYTAKNRMWYTQVEIQPPDILKLAGLCCIINNTPADLKTGEYFSFEWKKDMIVVSYKSL